MGAGLLCAVLGAAGPAQGATTIGSDLAAPGNSAVCSPDPNACTVMNPAIAGIPVAAPISGVVTSYGIHPGLVNAGGNFIRFRVLRAAGTGIYQGVSSSATAHITASGQQRISVRQPITAGDAIGLDVDPPRGNFTVMTGGSEAGTTRLQWEPSLADGAALGPTFSQTPGPRFIFNATVEGDADGDGFGDESQDKCPGASGTADGCAPVKKCKKGFVRKKVKTKSGKIKKRCVKKKRKK